MRQKRFSNFLSFRILLLLLISHVVFPIGGGVASSKATFSASLNTNQELTKLFLPDDWTPEKLAAKAQGKELMAKYTSDPYLKQKLYREAFTYYSLASVFGNSIAQYKLGCMYDAGQGVKQDYEEALIRYQKAASQKHVLAQGKLRDIYNAKQGVFKDSKQALMRYQKLLSEGDPFAEIILGWMYRDGFGLERDDKKAFVIFTKAANQGYVAAQHNLAWMYEEGRGIDKNEKEAVNWYLKAARQGYMVSQCNLGEMYGEGRGIEKDEKEAVVWYRKAADQGDVTAQFALGVMYQNGRGVAKDEKEAAKWYRAAAEQGDVRGQVNLGAAYAKGHGVDKDEKEAIRWFKAAAEQGIVEAQYNLGAMYEDTDEKEAIKWLKVSADQGFGPAQYKMGERYEEGRGLERSDEEAREWYKKAAEQDEIKAQYNLAVMYITGRGRSKDDDLAFHWFKKAARQGYKSAQNNVGVFYANGRGVKQSYKRAIKWWSRAAEQGDIESQYHLGRAYKKGWGVEPNAKIAAEWFRRSAEQEHILACFALGKLYLKGRGVERDERQAFYWFKKASEQKAELVYQRLGARYVGNDGVEHDIAAAHYNMGVLYMNGQGVERDEKQAFYYFKKAAEQGDRDALYALGQLLVEGEDIAKDEELAFYWVEKAANHGHIKAQLRLFEMYHEGKGTQKDTKAAAQWCRKAAERGNALAQYNLGVLYKEGQGVEQSYEKELEWYTKAAEQNEVSAQHNIGVMYENGQGVKQSYEEAFKWYQKAAGQGHTSSQHNLGLMFFEGRGVKNDEKEAVRWFKMAAEQGDMGAQYNLGLMYYQAKGVEKSYEKAFEWYTKAAEQGQADAQHQLGVMHEKGHCVKQSYEEAFKWYQKAADQGHAQAQATLGMDYVGHRAVTSRNDIKAAEYFIKAIRQDFNMPTIILGVMYHFGYGVLKDENKAIKYLKKTDIHEDVDVKVDPKLYSPSNKNEHSFKYMYSRLLDSLNDSTVTTFFGHEDLIPRLLIKVVEREKDKNMSNIVKSYEESLRKGEPFGQLVVGLFYHYGLGVTQDLTRAIEWYKEAAQRGDPDAQVLLSKIYASEFNGLKDMGQSRRWFIRAMHSTFKHFEINQSFKPACFSLEPSIPNSEHQEIAWLLVPDIRHPIGLAPSIEAYLKSPDAFLKEESRQDTLISLSRHRDTKAAADLGELYAEGSIERSSTTTDKEVYGWLNQAIELYNNPAAQYRLGRMYEYGWGTPMDVTLAVACFTEAAHKWHVPAQKALAEAYRYGRGINQSDEEALRWYRRAAKQGDQGATGYIRDMANENIADAIYALGKAHEEGWGIAKDEEEAYEQYKIAAFDYHHPKAQYALVSTSLALKDSNDNKLEALDLLTQAARQEARKRYLKAIGKKYKLSELQELSEQGYYKAQQALAELYQKGSILPPKTFKDVIEAYEEAVRLHELAFESKGKHLRLDSYIQAKDKLTKLKQFQNQEALHLQEDKEGSFGKFLKLYGGKRDLEPDFLCQVAYLCSKADSLKDKRGETIQNLIQFLSSYYQKNKHNKISQGLMNMLVEAAEQEGLKDNSANLSSRTSLSTPSLASFNSNNNNQPQEALSLGAKRYDLSDLSGIFQATVMERSWSYIPAPNEMTKPLKLFLRLLSDYRVELFNSCIRSPDRPVDEGIFKSSVAKILDMYERAEKMGLITQQGLHKLKTGQYGSRETLEKLLTHNKKDPRFTHRVVKIADILDARFKEDKASVAAQLTSWAKAGFNCPKRSEEETYKFYMAHLTDPNQQSDDLSKDYWTLELRVALSLAKLREQLVDEIVPRDEIERIHQVAHLKKKARRTLSLIGDAENANDTLEWISVKPEYKEMTLETIVEEVLKHYTPERMAQHIASEISKAGNINKPEDVNRRDRSLIPYDKLFRRLRFQFLRDSIEAKGYLDITLFKEEDFILSEACDQRYIDTQLALLRPYQAKEKQPFIDWQALKGKSYEVAKQRLEGEFYEEDMMGFSIKGAQAILRGMGYVEEQFN